MQAKWVLCVVVLGAIGYWLNVQRTHSPLLLRDQYALALYEFVTNHESSHSKVAISYNACLDLIVKAVPVFQALGYTDLSTVQGEPSDFEEVNDMNEILRLFTLYQGKGSAVERHVTQEAVFDALVEKAKEQPRAQYFAGGNAALMANGLAKKGSTVILGGPVGRGMVRFLDSSIALPTQDEEWKDEIHLILEYEKGEVWNGVASPRANRMILTHDYNNIHIEGVMKSFEHSVTRFNPDMIVLTGFHMMGSMDAQFRKQQIDFAFETYARIANGRDLPVHVELASMGSTAYWVQLLSEILPKAHSIGLNEQELFSVYSALGGTEFQSSEFTSPDPKLIIATIGYIFEASNSEVFQRVHFHCLHFHIVALRPTKRANDVWPRSRAALSVAAGALATTQNACFNGNTGMVITEETDLFVSDVIDVPVTLPSPTRRHSSATRKVSLNVSGSPTFYVHYDAAEFWISPILVCKFPKKTVGLGDSISAAGLAYSL